jgi:hypothetical protein
MPLFSTPSPKDLALATWRDVQRPQYLARIAQNNRKEQALRLVESGQRDPKISDPRK